MLSILLLKWKTELQSAFSRVYLFATQMAAFVATSFPAPLPTYPHHLIVGGMLGDKKF